MNAFVQRCGSRVIGALSGFDRMLFRGTIRFMAHASGLLHYLWEHKVLLKDFGDWSESLTQQIRAESEQVAHNAGRPVKYVSSPSLSKEQIATEIAERDGITNGLVCVLEAVEPCQSYEVHRNRARKKLELVNRSRKCLHLYHYLMHEQFGMMHVRVQTWMPFGVRVCLNGRSWLARQMDQAGIDYVQRDNCFTSISDLPGAQRLLDDQLTTCWPTVLDGLAVGASPARSRLLTMHGRPMEYYWSADQTEWATDVMFDDAEALQQIYRPLVRQGVLTMGATDVLQFMDKMPNRFVGTVTTDLKLRSEGLRIKHQVNGNSVKMYDKQQTVLRVETTINDPSQFKVFRGTEANPQDQKWRQMRKGVADLHRRAEVSQASNDRYLSHLAEAECPQTVEQLLMPLSKRITRDGRRYRGLRVMEQEDAELLSAVADGKFAINGFRNADIRQTLFGVGADKAEQRKQAGRVSRKLGLLKAHGLIKRVPKTRRWLLTEDGKRVTTLLAAARSASVPALLKIAA